MFDNYLQVSWLEATLCEKLRFVLFCNRIELFYSEAGLMLWSVLALHITMWSGNSTTDLLKLLDHLHN